MLYVFSYLNVGRFLFRIGNTVACTLLRFGVKRKISTFCRTVGSPGWTLFTGSPLGKGNVFSPVGTIFQQKMRLLSRDLWRTRNWLVRSTFSPTLVSIYFFQPALAGMSVSGT